MTVTVRDDGGALKKALEAIMVKNKLLGISDAMKFCISEYVNKNDMKDIDMSSVMLRVQRNRFKNSMFESYNLPSIKESLLTLALKGADVDTLWKAFNEAKQTEMHDKNNKRSWKSFKRIKKSHFKRLSDVCSDMRPRYPIKFIVENIGFDNMFKRTVMINIGADAADEIKMDAVKKLNSEGRY